MNERIKELADKAIEDMPGAWNIPDEFCKKFAVLITRKCMNLVKDCYAEPESGQSPYQTVCASTIIEEYFGVEE